MTISVVIAVHNGVEFLEQQINSILNQTVTVDEIVICNDFSSDSSQRVESTAGIAKESPSSSAIADVVATLDTCIVPVVPSGPFFWQPPVSKSS